MYEYIHIELIIKRLDCKETIKSTTFANKLRMTKDTYTPLKLPNIVGEIIKHNLGTSPTNYRQQYIHLSSKFLLEMYLSIE
jgi:hypothetical protein